MASAQPFQRRTTEQQERLSKFLNLDLFVYETQEISPEKSREQFSAHLDYQEKLEKSGVLFGAGPLYDQDSDRPSAGLIIIRAENMAAGKRIADRDPMHRSGARRYTLRRWRLNEGAFNIRINVSDQSAVFE